MPWPGTDGDSGARSFKSRAPTDTAKPPLVKLEGSNHRSHLPDWGKVTSQSVVETSVGSRGAPLPLQGIQPCLVAHRWVSLLWAPPAKQKCPTSGAVSHQESLPLPFCSRFPLDIRR